MNLTASLDSTARRYNAFRQVVRDLLQEREASGHWIGELSTSALSTATAVSALSTVLAGDDRHAVTRDSSDDGTARSMERAEWQRLQQGGVQWLVQHQNRDGGWGDTELSHSNISTSMLVRAAFYLAGVADRYASEITRVDRYIEQQGGIAGLRRRYGKDKTFAVPILANCAIAGQVDWREVSALPFEAAWVPQRFYRWMQLPVVSYAIPALVAIGQARFYHRPPRNPITRQIRRAAVEPTLKVLLRMQPESGGYLEAIPLTSFVVMGLASAQRADHPVVRAGLRFIETSVREDGSWPIDTNLATWNTSLSMNALSIAVDAPAPYAAVETDPTTHHDGVAAPGGPESSWTRQVAEALSDERLHRWLLNCQHSHVHPFTGAEPGGWGWTDLSGAVPDADDTPGAMLALRELDRQQLLNEEMRDRVGQAVRMGASWLLGLQNRDGGWPTFCRGWGKLPFDRSGADLTAHALRALRTWLPDWLADERFARRIQQACEKGLRYLAREQRADGSWLPLWFGNQDQPDDENPVYGTAKVLFALRDLEQLETEMAGRGLEWLRRQQNPDGGWGGGPSWGVSQAGPLRSVFQGSKNRETVGDRNLPWDRKTPDKFLSPSDRSQQGDEPPRDLEVKGGVDRPGGGQAGPHKQQPVSSGEFPGGSSVEETALAIEAWLAFVARPTGGSNDRRPAELERGIDWLTRAVESGWHHWQSPIGFYFAKLWYHERLYPLIFTASAMGQVIRHEGGPR